VVPAELVAGTFGATLLACSLAVSPDVWRQFLEVAFPLVLRDAPGFLPLPYTARLEPRIGEPLLVVAVVVALSTLWFAALSTLAAS
jgi:hypothetical protein